MSLPAARPSATARGFTLLEVMVSIGILGIALLAIGDLNGGAVRMHAYGKQLTIATQLARGKVLDLKEQLRKDGLSDYSKEYHGAFEDEGYPAFKWKAVVVKPEVDVEPEQLLNAVSGGLGIDSANSPMAAMNPLAPGGPLAGLVQGQVKSMVELLKTSVREVKLTVSWPGARGANESFDLAEHIVVLAGAQQNAAANATPMGGGVGGTSAAPGAPPGMNGAPGMPGMPMGGPRAPGLTLPGMRP